MKYSYIICTLLFIGVMSQMGGWKKGSFREDDLGIDRAYKKAFEEYSKENPGSDIDSTVRLTIYRQFVNGINYRMTFIDLKRELNVIQEYVISSPPFSNYRDKPFQLYAQASHRPSEENLSLNDEKVGRIQKELFKVYKESRDFIYNINKIEVVETTLDFFYIVYTGSKNKEQIFVAGQSKEDNYNFEVVEKLK